MRTFITDETRVSHSEVTSGSSPAALDAMFFSPEEADAYPAESNNEGVTIGVDEVVEEMRRCL